jgi:hypothetical protein
MDPFKMHSRWRFVLLQALPIGGGLLMDINRPILDDKYSDRMINVTLFIIIIAIVGIGLLAAIQLYRTVNTKPVVGDFNGMPKMS